MGGGRGEREQPGPHKANRSEEKEATGETQLTSFWGTVQLIQKSHNGAVVSEETVPQDPPWLGSRWAVGWLLSLTPGGWRGMAGRRQREATGLEHAGGIRAGWLNST